MLKTTPTNLSVWWESSLDGILPVEGTPDSGGCWQQHLSEQKGSHSDRLGRGQHGKLGSASVSVQWVRPIAPICSITSPTDSSSVLLGQQFAFEGLAEDRSCQRCASNRMVRQRWPYWQQLARQCGCRRLFNGCIEQRHPHDLNALKIHTGNLHRNVVMI